MRKQIYLKVCQQLEQVPEIRLVGFWNEQLAMVQQTRPFVLPAVFLEFEPYEIRQLSMHAQEADITLRLHILTRAMDFVDNRDKRMAVALQYFDLIDDVNKAMATLRGDGFSTFMHTQSATNHNHAEIIESIECWQCRATDATAMRQAQMAVGAGLHIAEKQ
jgi:hypothetical protein|nr:MAG TPA: hypothetical protein [Caudoviricetes sp.]